MTRVFKLNRIYEKCKFFIGLGIYGDSNSESEEDNLPNQAQVRQQSPGENDSDDELKVGIWFFKNIVAETYFLFHALIILRIIVFTCR